MGSSSSLSTCAGTLRICLGGCSAAAGHLSRHLSRHHTTAGTWLLPVALGGSSLRLFGRESIFKFSHTKPRKKFQNLDLEPDSTSKSLQATRRVYERGREAWQVGSSSSLSTCTGRYEPLGGDVRLRLGASPGAATAASPPDSDRDALVQTPTVCRRISR